MAGVKFGHVLDQANLELDPNTPHTYILSGVLSRHTVESIHKRSYLLFKDKKTIVIDLSQTIRSDSSGIALLIEWMRSTIKNKQSISFTQIPEAMIDIAKISGLNKILPVK